MRKVLQIRKLRCILPSFRGSRSKDLPAIHSVRNLRKQIFGGIGENHKQNDISADDDQRLKEETMDSDRSSGTRFFSVLFFRRRICGAAGEKKDPPPEASERIPPPVAADIARRRAERRIRNSPVRSEPA